MTDFSSALNDIIKPKIPFKQLKYLKVSLNLECYKLNWSIYVFVIVYIDCQVIVLITNMSQYFKNSFVTTLILYLIF